MSMYIFLNKESVKLRNQIYIDSTYLQKKFQQKLLVAKMLNHTLTPTKLLSLWREMDKKDIHFVEEYW